MLSTDAVSNRAAIIEKGIGKYIERRERGLIEGTTPYLTVGLRKIMKISVRIAVAEDLNHGSSEYDARLLDVRYVPSTLTVFYILIY
jgi:hypothetical protein